MKWTTQLAEIFKKNRIVSKSNEADVVTDQNNEILPESIPINFNLRALVISDGHGCLDAAEIPPNPVDVCLLLGDFLIRDIEVIKRCVVGVPIYGVLGNHDGFELYNMCGIENIHEKIVDVNGVRIAGIQGSLRYKNSEFPFYTDEESVDIAEQMEAADILISHDGPKYLHGSNDWAHSGLQGVTHYCQKHNVPLNIHGHFHDNMSSVLENGTLSMCCYGATILTISPDGVKSQMNTK
jgi:Icc-related predicted phosphoesterase